MSFFNFRIVGDRRSGKDRRKSNIETNIEIERRSGKNRRMRLWDRLPEDQTKTVEITIEELEREAL